MTIELDLVSDTEEKRDAGKIGCDHRWGPSRVTKDAVLCRYST